MNEENVSRVRHLEPLHQLPFDVLDHQDVISNEIINEISKNDKDAFLPVNVDECVGRCLLYTSPSPRDATLSRMPSSA